MTHYTSIATPHTTEGINAGLAAMAQKGWKYVNMTETTQSINGITIPWGAQLMFEKEADDLGDAAIAADVAEAEAAAAAHT